MAEKKMFGAAPQGAPEQVAFGRGYMWGDGANGAFDQDQGYVWGGNNYAADQDVERYRSLGAAAMQRQAPTLNYGGATYALNRADELYDADQAGLDAQRRASNLYQGAMDGGTPSAATLQAQAVGGQNLQGLLQAQAGGRTSLANAAMARSGLDAYGNASVGNVGQLYGGRAGELMSDRAGYGSSLGNMRMSNANAAQGFAQVGTTRGNMAYAQGQLGLDQQRMNQQYQQEMEKLAMGVRANEIAAAQQTEARKIGLENFKAAQDADENNRIFQMAGAGAQAGGSLLASYAGSYGNSGGGSNVTSDERAKEPVGQWDVLPLYNPEGLQLRQSEGGRGFYDVEAPPQETIGGGMARPSLASAAMAQHAATAPQAQAPMKQRQMTPDELLAAADREIAGLKATEKRSLAQGASVREPDAGVMADANRKMAGEPYQYRPEFTPPDEIPGQVHHGFMAQNLEQNPVTATAVEVGPDGMRQVHGHRMLQAVASGLSDLQRQMDETRLAMRGKR